MFASISEEDTPVPAAIDALPRLSVTLAYSSTDRDGAVRGEWVPKPSEGGLAGAIVTRRASIAAVAIAEPCAGVAVSIARADRVIEERTVRIHWRGFHHSGVHVCSIEDCDVGSEYRIVHVLLVLIATVANGS